MKSFFLAFLIFLSASCCTAQPADSSSRIFPDELAASLKDIVPDDMIEELLKKITSDPEIYNRVWAKIMELKKKSGGFGLFRDLDIKFKTFQNPDTNITGLGFSYDWNFDWRRYNEKPLKRNGLSIQFNANGNVAFKRELNPHDFLATGISFGGFQYTGGVLSQSSPEINTALNELETALAGMGSVEEIENSPEWKSFNEKLVLTDQYFFGLDGQVNMESNQDFTQKQWAYGIQFGVGAKGWSENSALGNFNIPDYPFALVRLITGTDRKFTPAGYSLPMLHFQLDYVQPSGDGERKALTGNKKGFARFKLEAGFRTLVSETKAHSLFFNAGYRFYKELNPPAEIRMVKMDRYHFFAASLTSSKGFFVSYANGRLPFDISRDEVYEIGFRYGFN